MGAEELEGWNEILQGAVAQASPPEVENVAAQPGGQQPLPAFDYQNQVGEVQRRLKMAALYDVVLSNPLFEGDGEMVSEVEAEFRAFAMQRQAALLGVAAPAAPVVEAQFSADQAATLALVAELGPQGVRVLHALVDTMIAKARASGAPLPSAAPPQKPAKLGLRKRELPAAMRKAELPVAVPPSRPAPAARPNAPAKPVVAAAAPISVADIPVEGSEYVEDGEKYTAAWVDVSADDYGPSEQPTMQGLRPGQAARLGIGVRVFNVAGQLKKLVGKRKSGQRKGRGGIPFPAQQSMTLLTAASAGVADATARGGDRGLNAAVGILQQ